MRHGYLPPIRNVIRRGALLRTRADFLDLEYGQFLAMAPLAPIVLPPLFLEYEHLRSARLLNNLCTHGGVGNSRRPDCAGCAGLAVAEREHLGQRNLAADFTRDTLHHDLVALRNAVLLTASFYDCEHWPNSNFPN